MARLFGAVHTTNKEILIGFRPKWELFCPKTPEMLFAAFARAVWYFFPRQRSDAAYRGIYGVLRGIFVGEAG